MSEHIVAGVQEEWDERSVEAFLEAAQVSHGITYRGPDWFRWKFEQSPYGPAIVAVARGEGCGIVGAVAYGRWQLRLASLSIPAALSYETFVHPRHRGQGLFVALADLAARRAREESVEILFNFPNPASRPGFRKLGWRDMGGLQTWILPCSPLRIIAEVCRARSISLGPLVPDSPLPLGEPWEPPQWLKANPNTGSPEVLVSDRPWDLLQWRFFTHPVARYEVAESDGLGCIFRSGFRGPLREAQIMDVFPVDEMVADRQWPMALRRLARSVARRNDSDTVSMITTPGTRYAAALPQAGFIRVPNRASFLCRPLSQRMDDILSSSQWALTATDIHTF